MPLIKLMGLEQMLFLDQPVFAGKNGRSHMPSDAVVHGVAQNTGGQQYQHDLAVAHEPRARHHAGSKQQGIARQKRRDHQAGFTKDDDEKNCIDPEPVLLHQLKQMHVNVQHKIQKITDHFHPG